MDKYDYITATIEEEKDRLEKIINYLKENNSLEDILSYQERYNDIVMYLNAKKRYHEVLKNSKNDRGKLELLNKQKYEYEVDNILLEDTLLSKFHEDTNNKYRNILYEDIKYTEENIRNILYLIFEKQSNYSELLIKRSRLKSWLDKNKYPKTYETLLNQDSLIEKQDSILDEIFIVENNLKIANEKMLSIEKSIMTPSILKILYEFWIINTYDIDKVDRSKLFLDNRTLVSIKNNTN